MKILLIHQYYLEDDTHGGSRFNEMAKVWKEQGHEVVVLSGMLTGMDSKMREEYRGKKFVSKIQEGGIHVMRCYVSESYNVSFLGRLWSYFSFVFSSSWAGMFKIKNDYDVIMVTSPPLFVGITAYLLSVFKKKPFVFEIRDLWPESAVDTGVVTNKWIIKLAYWFESFIYKKAKLINTLTPAFQKIVIENKKVPAEKVIMIPNAADFSLAEKVMQDFDYKEFRKKIGLNGKFVITYVGAHGVANHLIQLIDVAEKLTDTNVVFQLIGDGMKKKELVTEVKKRNLTNVIFRDPVIKSEIFKYILASDMGTSVLKKVDTFKTIYSNKSFDYMSCKKPILLLIDGVSRELIEKAECGIYAEPENTEDIVNKIQKCLAFSNEELNQKGENGYQYAKKYFDRTLLAKQFVKDIEEKVVNHV
ncbi:MAG: glycosyltransferase family 4 protein [Flavobacteriales bacterium]